MLTIRGNDVSHLITVLQVGGRGPAAQEVNRQSIPNRAGSYLQSTRVPERILPVRFLLVGSDMEELRTNVDELNLILYPDDLTEDEQKKGYSLKFVDEPNMEYFGLPDGTPDWSEITDKGIGEISFVCFDPHKYGVEQSQLINDSDNPSEAIVYNDGGKETYPVITATMKRPTTFLAVYSPDKYLMLGRPINVDETPLDKEELILRNNCETMTGFANGTYVDGGQVTGTMYSTGYVFKATDYGTGTGWHGPAKKISLSEPLQDFRVDTYVEHASSANDQVGRIEIYLLDQFNNVVGKMSMADTNVNVKTARGEARAGDLSDGEYIISHTSNAWVPFMRGLLSIERVGDKFTAYIAERESGTNKHHSRMTRHFYDVDLEHQAEVTQIQVHLGAYASYATPKMEIQEFRAYKINENTTVEIPYIVETDDVITIDHSKNEIRKNGADFKWAKDFGSDLFPLNKGENTLAVYPNDAADVAVTWRERWL